MIVSLCGRWKCGNSTDDGDNEQKCSIVDFRLEMSKFIYERNCGFKDEMSHFNFYFSANKSLRKKIFQ
jgi:hypothetical protein